MKFIDFFHKYILKNKATSDIQIQQVLLSLSLNEVAIYLRDSHFSTDNGIVKLHSYKRTRWDCYTNEIYFDSYGCVPPKNLSKFTKKRIGYCFYSEYQI